VSILCTSCTCNVALILVRTRKGKKENVNTNDVIEIGRRIIMCFGLGVQKVVLILKWRILNNNSASRRIEKFCEIIFHPFWRTLSIHESWSIIVVTNTGLKLFRRHQHPSQGFEMYSVSETFTLFPNITRWKSSTWLHWIDHLPNTQENESFPRRISSVQTFTEGGQPYLCSLTPVKTTWVLNFYY
jgi:hypothetical protein